MYSESHIGTSAYFQPISITMPRQRKKDTLMRQWAILGLLPRVGSGVSIAEIHHQLSTAGFPRVTKRTIERDLEELEANEFLPIACDDCSRPFRWRWRRGSLGFFPDICPTDAVTLAMVERILKQALPDALLDVLETRFAIARRFLERDKAGGNKYARWPELFAHIPPGLSLEPPGLHDGILPRVQEALLEGWRLEVVYDSRSAATTLCLKLHPLGLVQYGTNSYLVALANDHTDARLYALHRFREANVLTGTRAFRPQGFSLEKHLANGVMDFGPGGMIRLGARVSPKLAGYLEERPLGPDQRLTRRGDVYHLSATIRESWNLRFWLLSQGPEITVTRPRSLREEIRRLLAEAVENYG